MKKINFTIQVFALLALLPAYVLLEMDHGAAALSGTNNRLTKNPKVEKPIISQSLNSEIQNEMLYPPKYFGVYDLGSIKIK